MKIEEKNNLNHNQDVLFKEIKEKFQKRRFFNIRKNTLQGCYIYGTVGSGKTFLLKEIQNFFQKEIGFFHYHNFIIYIHNLLKQVNKKTNKIKLVAKEIRKSYEFLFIDELEILDITDAMLIKDLVTELNKLKIKIFFTTNITPDNIYEGGIQRDSFWPFITYLKKNFLILNLSSESDLRENNSKSKNQHFFWPSNDNNNKVIDNKLSILSNEKIQTYGEIEINKNIFHYRFLSENAIGFEFSKLFESNSSIKDFEYICLHFRFVGIYNARSISKSENNIIKRFINFIDLAYINQVTLFISSENNVFEIYNEGQYLEKFNRSKSRLKEMEIKKYE